MNELEMRLRVQNTVEQTISALANQGVSFTMLEDALYKVLSLIKDKAYEELLYSISQEQQSAEIEQTEKEEDNNGDT